MPFTSKEIDALVSELGLHDSGNLSPTASQIRSLLAEDLGGPLQFVNFLAFHDVAQYKNSDDSTMVSGEEAYNRYGAVAIQHVTEGGGSLFALNTVEQTLIGADDEWQQIIIVQYPNVDVFINMLRSPSYHAALHHRNAGLKATKLIVTRPLLV
jgi:uncharacterized protein (DUF1330 family)